MLVYLKEQMGRTEINGHAICGKYYNYGRGGPANISRQLYLKHREVLIEVPITSEWLSEKFGKEFPPIKFTIEEMYRIKWRTLVSIARLMGIEYVGNSNKEPSNLHTRALRLSVIKRIEGI